MLYCRSNNRRLSAETTTWQNQNNTADASVSRCLGCFVSCLLTTDNCNTCYVPPSRGSLYADSNLLRYMHRSSWSKWLCPQGPFYTLLWVHLADGIHIPYKKHIRAPCVLHSEGTAAIYCHLKWHSKKKNTLAGLEFCVLLKTLIKTLSFRLSHDSICNLVTTVELFIVGFFIYKSLWNHKPLQSKTPSVETMEEDGLGSKSDLKWLCQ